MKQQGFIDWMKASGMLFILIGHIIGSPYHIFNMISQPIYTKQLGVCFFIFVMGWSLANENKTSFKVVFTRIFPVYFYAIAITILLSSISFFTINDINESNYMPFFLGINVFFNFFPANPTTWYIGTYLHILLFWFFFLQGKDIGKKHVMFAFIFEILIRSVIIYSGKDFVAYMLLPNWLTVFLLGSYLHKKKDCSWQPKTIFFIIIWLVAVGLWSSPLNQLSWDQSFPFRALISNETWALPFRSLVISIVYLVNTFVFFEIFRRLPKLRIVAFFARNSLITFIIHMPIIYAFAEDIYSLSDSFWSQRLTLLLILFVGIALISEFIQKQIDIKYYQNKTWIIASNLYTRLFKISRH